MDIEKLIETLRQHGVSCVRAYGKYCSICDEAATALSTLQTENEKLRNEVERQRRSADDRKHLYENAERAYMKVVAELEQVKRERDAIEQDFRAFTKQWWEQDSGFPCRWCKFENSGGCEWKTKQPDEEKICAGRAFEWRGQKED